MSDFNVSDISVEARRRAPSGAQVELVCGDQRVTVVEVGGALRSYTLGGHALLDGYDYVEHCTGARGQTLIPWPNRLRDGTYQHGGKKQQLPLTEPEKHNAIHGLVRWTNWSITDREVNRVVMRHSLYPQAGWPFLLDLTIAYTLGSEGLSVRTTATNVGTAACPYGTGAHPYLTVGTATIDELILSAPGTRWMPSDDRGLPIGSESVEGTDLDFRTPRAIGPIVLDTAYSDLLRDEAGFSHVELTEPRSGFTVRLWMDDVYQYLMLFTGDTLADGVQRRRGLGVEPMTCAPNALQSGEGLRTLEPGVSFVSTWGMSASTGNDKIAGCTQAFINNEKGTK